jgi:predicted nucleic acid-binding protein
LSILKRNMASEKLFIDSDILLDLFFDRRPFSIFAIMLFDSSLREKFSLNTSALVAANLYYIISKQQNKKSADECLSTLLKYIQVLPLEIDDLEYGLKNVFDDFEDAIQYHIAEKNNCTKILTRNLKDYKHAKIPVLTAEHFFKK